MKFVTLRRRAGGSFALTIPRAFVSTLGLSDGARVRLAMVDGRLVAEGPGSGRAPRDLALLISDCDPTAPLSAEDEAWLSGEPLAAEVV